MSTVHQKPPKIIPALLIVIGGMLIVFSFLADVLGYGDTGSFGIGQLFLLIVGGIVVLIGVFGKRSIQIYRDIAVVFLNTILFILLLELGAIILGRISFRDRQAGIENLPYYAAQDWSRVYWDEAKLAGGVRYQPYTVWRHAPFQGETINFNQDGIRHTPRADCQPKALKIFTFGGSTMLGWGAPDWGTIAAYLQTGLGELSEGPVCVINYGEDGYVSTQSLIALMLQLQSGNIPDIVIFYDGVNEVIAAYESGKPVAHVTLPEITSRFEEQENPFVKIGKATRIYSLSRRWLDVIETENLGNRSDISVHQGTRIIPVQLAEEMMKAYLGNYELAGALAREYGFDYYFFLQPHLAVGEKSLTKEERAIKNRMDPVLGELAIAFYGKVASVGPELEHFRNLADLFDDQDRLIWIDAVGHITPEGNHLVARAILETVMPQAVER